jgi:hypothetical protein
MTGLFAITYVLPRYQTYLFTVCMPLAAILADTVLSGRSTVDHELRG